MFQENLSSVIIAVNVEREVKKIELSCLEKIINNGVSVERDGSCENKHFREQKIGGKRVKNCGISRTFYSLHLLMWCVISNCISFKYLLGLWRKEFRNN